MGLEVLDDKVNASWNVVLMGRDVDLRVFGCLIWVRDTSEVRDETSTGFLVQALGVTLLGDLKRDVSMDLEEGEAGLFVYFTSGLASLSVGADESGDGKSTRISKELGNFSNTANVFDSVFFAEAQVLVQTKTNVVAIKSVAHDALFKKSFLI